VNRHTPRRVDVAWDWMGPTGELIAWRKSRKEFLTLFSIRSEDRSLGRIVELVWKRVKQASASAEIDDGSLTPQQLKVLLAMNGRRVWIPQWWFISDHGPDPLFGSDSNVMTKH
jgi:hypothetical protein